MPNELWGEILSSELSTSAKITNSHPTCRIDKDVKLVCKKRMKGYFACLTCHKAWDSTQVTVEFSYGYSYKDRCGTVSIEEYGQSCQRCARRSTKKNVYIVPTFTKEGMGHAALYLKNKILEKFYGERMPEHEPREDYVPRRNPHDSEHCEACKKGKCSEGGDFNRNRRGYCVDVPLELGVKSSINWYLLDGRKKILLAGRSQILPENNILRNRGIERSMREVNILRNPGIERGIREVNILRNPGIERGIREVNTLRNLDIERRMDRGIERKNTVETRQVTRESMQKDRHDIVESGRKNNNHNLDLLIAFIVLCCIYVVLYPVYFKWSQDQVQKFLKDLWHSFSSQLPNFPTRD